MANIDSEVLDKYLVQVRRVAESREKGAEKEILKLYKTLVKDINGFLGNEYAKYAEDDSLTFEILYRKGEYARFLEEVNKKVDSVIPEVKTAVEGLVNDTYEKCYNGMVEGVKKSATAEALRNEFKAVKAVRPEVIKAAVQNPIPKLRLTPTLERNRKQVISSIKREIGVGLSQGDRMSTMAKRINDRVNINYRQSMLIARTEAHRVRETGLNDAANEVDEILKANGSEYRKIKIWNTCEDASVRDTHAKMDGVVVLQDEKFELPSGATADCPGTSGVASEDCNCRCFLTHDIVTDAEFYELTGRHFPDYDVDKSGKSSIIKSVTIDDVQALAKEGTVSTECINEIANALGDDAKYFDSVRLISSDRNADGTIDLLRTNVEQKGTWAETVLEINEDVFKGKTLDEVNGIISVSHEHMNSVITSLQEAVWHEVGHAKLMYGESYARANSITDTLNDYHITGISIIAAKNGDECLAECYVLKRRGEEMPEQAKDLWDKFMKE